MHLVVPIIFLSTVAYTVCVLKPNNHYWNVIIVNNKIPHLMLFEL